MHFNIELSFSNTYLYNQLKGNTYTFDSVKMADSGKDNEAALEWLKLKTDKGQKADYQIKAEMEDVGNKFLRKFKENPLVPIGKLIYKLIIEWKKIVVFSIIYIYNIS